MLGVDFLAVQAWAVPASALSLTWFSFSSEFIQKPVGLLCKSVGRSDFLTGFTKAWSDHACLKDFFLSFFLFPEGFLKAYLSMSGDSACLGDTFMKS